MLRRVTSTNSPSSTRASTSTTKAPRRTPRCCASFRPVQRTLRSGQQILDTEEAPKVIDGVSNLTLVPCPCRTRTQKLGIRECTHDTPVGLCIMMETSALYFQSIGLGKPVSAAEAENYFDSMQDLGLVGKTENYEEAGHNVICLCCCTS